ASCRAVALMRHADAPHREYHSVPTRRSSDLPDRQSRSSMTTTPTTARMTETAPHESINRQKQAGSLTEQARTPTPHPLVHSSARSEEHTSELQSRVDLVCRLLLEKQNNQPTT